jgi:hypothetical protein
MNHNSNEDGLNFKDLFIIQLTSINYGSLLKIIPKFYNCRHSLFLKSLKKVLHLIDD